MSVDVLNCRRCVLRWDGAVHVVHLAVIPQASAKPSIDQRQVAYPKLQWAVVQIFT